jgi:glutathione S-transferase
MALTLYDLAGADPDRRFSPYCWRIRLALAHKELPVETIPWRFTDKEMIAFSGQGRVPVLVDAGKSLAGSWTIANYLEQKYPDHSLFDGDVGTALTRFVESWTDTVLLPGAGPSNLDRRVCASSREGPRVFPHQPRAATGDDARSGLCGSRQEACRLSTKPRASAHNPENAIFSRWRQAQLR